MAREFDWHQDIHLAIDDPAQRRVLENSFDMLSQTPDGQELIRKAHENSGSAIEVRTDGQFRFGDRKVDLSADEGRSVIEPDGKGGWGGGLQVQLNKLMTPGQIAAGMPSRAVMDVVTHELYHSADPNTHPTVLKPQLVAMVDDAASRAVADSKLDPATRQRLAQDLSNTLQTKFGINGPGPVGTTGLEVTDVQYGIEAFTKDRPIRQEEMFAALRAHQPLPTPASDYRRDAAARLGIPADEIVIKPTAADGPLLAPTDSHQRGFAHTMSGSGLSASTSEPRKDTEASVRGQATAADRDPTIETQAVRYTNRMLATYAPEGPARDGYRDNTGYYLNPQSQATVESLTCRSDHLPVYDPGPAVSVLGQLHMPPTFTPKPCPPGRDSAPVR